VSEYSPSTQEQALQAWLRLVLAQFDTDTHTVQAIYARQAGTRPDKPYAALQVLTEVETGPPETELTDTAADSDFEHHADQHYLGTVQVDVYGDNHAQIMRVLRRSIADPRVREQNMTAKLYLVDSPGGQHSTILRDTSWEHRSQCDFRYAFAERDTTDVAAVESVVATVNANDLSQEVTVP